MPGNGVSRSARDSESVALGPNRVTFLLSGHDTAGLYSLTGFVMAPPPAPGPPVHVHSGEEETIYLIRGVLDVTLNGATTTLSGGSVAHVPRGMPHTLANPGPDSAQLLIIQSPPGAERYWAKAATLIAESDGPPDPALMQALAEEHHIHFQGHRRFADG